MQNSLVALLNQNLAEAIDLKLQAKQAHWNVKGTNFIALHELFDAIATEVDAAVDMVAERVVQLGGVAAGTLQAVSQTSKLAVYPAEIERSELHVKALAAALSAYIAKATALIEIADNQGDAITADMMTGIARGLDKQRWFVEAHSA